jgi:hypothetical protein
MRRRLVLPAAILVCLSLSSLACGADEEPAVVAPLTGLPATDLDVLERPALVVKYNNTRSSRPQAGLREADIVYEELVEGGVTRFAAVFHSTDADHVGPIRSARSTDISLSLAFGRPLFAFSGANEVFMAQIRASPLVELSYDWNPHLYTRVPERPAPDDIFTPTALLWAEDPGGLAPPAPVFTYRAGGDERHGDAVRVPGVSYFTGGAGSPSGFTWDGTGGRWLRDQDGEQHVDTADDVVDPANVVIQFVDYIDTGLVDGAGTPVPEARLLGEGDAWILTDGHLVEGSWSRHSDDEPTRFAGPDGEEVRLTPGRTWVALLPPGIAQHTTCADAGPDTAGC